jgi:hypothetical protein
LIVKQYVASKKKSILDTSDVDYLISTPTNYTCSHLSEHQSGTDAVSNDAVSNFLKREKFTPRTLWTIVERYITNRPTGF